MSHVLNPLLDRCGTADCFGYLLYGMNLLVAQMRKDLAYNVSRVQVFAVKPELFVSLPFGVLAVVLPDYLDPRVRGAWH
jgi:hypothetical protein